MKRKNNKGNNLPGLNLFINSIIVEEKKTVYEIEKQRKKHIYYNEYINQKSWMRKKRKTKKYRVPKC